MNPVSQSLKAIMPELSSRFTNLHSDINGHQNISMDFLCSNFRKINDNIVTVQNDVARTATVSNIRKNSSIAQVIKDVLIYLSHYHMRSLIPLTRWLMQIHTKHKICTT